MPDVHGDRSTTTTEHVLLSQFLFLHLVVVASSLPALNSGSLLLSERMTVSVSFSKQSQTGVLQLLEPFLLVLGLKKKAPKRMVLKIDHRRVVLLSFFSPGTACNSSWRHSPSHAKPCWLAAIHPESTSNWPETKAIEHAPPFTGHKLGGRDFDFGNVSSPGPLIWLPSCFAKQQSGHSSVIVWFCFSRKKPQKMKKITSSSKQETENQKNKPTFLESIWLCHVASHTAAQQTILPTWLDNVMSRIDVAAAASISRHAGAHVLLFPPYPIMNVTSNQSALNLNHFCRAPFRISGHIRWPITPFFIGTVILQIFGVVLFSVFSVVNGFTEIKETPKWEKYMERSRQLPRIPKLKRNRTLRDRSPPKF